MEFKIKHSLNFNPGILFEHGRTSVVHIPHEGIAAAQDVFAIQQLSAMRDYLIERAETILGIIDGCRNFEFQNERFELAQIIEIIKKAWVEVVE